MKGVAKNITKYYERNASDEHFILQKPLGTIDACWN